MESYGKRLAARLKDQGIVIAEDAAVILFDALLDELDAEVRGNDKDWDDIFIPVIGIVKNEGRKLIDKIDGQDDPAL